MTYFLVLVNVDIALLFIAFVMLTLIGLVNVTVKKGQKY